MLSYSGRDKLPTQADYPEAGAVILFEKTEHELFIASDHHLGYKESYHKAILYLNDKAEKWITRIIYLQANSTIEAFSARTIKPSGEIIELDKTALFPTQVKPDFVEYSDNKSVKFTFPGVEPGAILEYSYISKQSGAFFAGFTWRVQSVFPKLYTYYSLEVPRLLLKSNFNWNYIPVNMEIGPPTKQKSLMQERSAKDRSMVYYWEIKDVPPLKEEPQMPPYTDVAKYMQLVWQYKSWNDLTKSYWRAIKKRFNPEHKAFFKDLAKQIVGDATDEKTKIERIFNYTQKDYRYLATTIKQSGIIPHYAKDIVKNKYGDCKDMAVLNTVLLRALNIKAFPALVRTKSAGRKRTDIISLDFNHMITFVKDSSGNEYWLDATGSSCPLGDVYPQIEGVTALVLYPDGCGKFKQIPSSKSYQNRLIRHVIMQINDDGSLTGKVTLKFTGNENLIFRSRTKDASADEIKKIMERYVNSNLANISIDSLKYDDPMEIKKQLHITFNFRRDNTLAKNTRFLILKAGIFSLKSDLDKFLDVKRIYPIRFYSTRKITDFVEIHYNPHIFKIESLSENQIKKLNLGKLASQFSVPMPGKILYQREYSLNETSISPENYSVFRDFCKWLASSNEENIILQKQR